MAKSKRAVKQLPISGPKNITWLEVLIYIVIGYVLMNIVQAIFCGTKSVGVCKAGFWFIPVWLVIGMLYLICYRRR